MISVTMLTKDSARRLPEALGALRAFDEVLVLDTGSSDDTLSIAQGFSNVRIHSSPFIGFGPLHNQAAALARNDWILSLDSDEVLTPELSREIAGLALDEGRVYSIGLHNYYNGKWIRWCGWHPDRHVRLYNRKRARFTEAPVHETIIGDGLRELPLHAPACHYSYTCVADFLAKTQRYSDLFAQQNQGRVSSSLSKAFGRAFATFVKSYILKRGFMGGSEGLLISTSNAVSTFYRYAKLLEANQRRSLEVPNVVPDHLFKA